MTKKQQENKQDKPSNSPADALPSQDPSNKAGIQDKANDRGDASALQSASKTRAKQPVTSNAKTGTAQKSTPAKPLGSESPRGNNKHRAPFALFLSWINFLVLVCLIVAVFYFWPQLQQLLQQPQQVSALAQQTQQLEQVLAKQGSQQRAQQTQLQQQQQQFQQQAKQLRQSVQTQQQQIEEALAQPQPVNWQDAELMYLLDLAARKLWLEADPRTSRQLLLKVDHKLVQQNDRQWLELRKAIAQDLVTLDQVQRVDYTGISFSLQALAEASDSWPLQSVYIPEATTAVEHTEISENIDDWRTNLARAWHSFVDDFITVRRRDAAVTALLEPQQAWYLHTNLTRLFQQAELALWRGEQAMYKQQLQQASLWLTQYYDTEAPQVNSAQQRIAELSAQRVQADMPTELRSRALAETLLQPDAASANITSDQVEQDVSATSIVPADVTPDLRTQVDTNQPEEQ